jgi:hypothetical protein
VSLTSARNSANDPSITTYGLVLFDDAEELDFVAQTGS